jgi:hypothetical protein
MSAATFLEVDAIEGVFHAREWDFATARAREIDAHWEALRTERPGLFDGRVLLVDLCEVEERAGARILRTRHFATRFRNFVAQRDFGFPDAGVRNCFAAAALRAADGCFVLGQMGAHTANAGRIYFPCGTPDMEDVRGALVDLDGSALRELFEETGLGEGDITPAPGWTIVFEGPRIACMKEARAHAPGDELAARIGAFLARQAEPELSGVHVVRSKADLRPDVMPGFVLAYLERALAQPAG